MVIIELCSSYIFIHTLTSKMSKLESLLGSTHAKILFYKLLYIPCMVEHCDSLVQMMGS